ncbi:Extracellular ribonuclease precursor [Pseudobythopirellula maris]|uniref:Extracellular ribonuclease n=1 Tax=Pseudobythopirellula maris TaxID=2527991 RepID=A0A5C5ZJE2_9BACT|nr:endonuclease [Pseudobythopirellula maris]TWT87502.1 Extracellular ribonuclease precursor [Pseudobythopirellula maris]
MKFFRSAAAALSLSLLAFSGAATADQWDSPASYYNAASGSGSTLKNQLRSIMSSGHILRSYGDFRYSAAITDQDPNNPSRILLVYNRASVPATWNSGSTWNREHLWPQSRQPGSASNSSRNNLSDPHSLRPSNPSINSSRGNKPFGYDNTTGSYGSQGSYYFPGDADKGDVARAMFYHDTRWGSYGLSLTDGFPGGNQMGDLSSMVAWNYLDTPDEFERRRNHTIYSSSYNPSYYTNNRNAYVDHPEYVWSVFVDQQNDSRLYVGGGPDANGGSSLDVDLGPVIVGATPGSTSLSLNKVGQDGVYYEVTASGDATSSVNGRYNAFAINSSGADSRSLNVGLNVPASTPGAFAGQVTIDNLDITTGGGAGRGANDQNDVIDVYATVYDHASPSFASGVEQTSLLFDFGVVAQGASLADFEFDLFNYEALAGLTAGLDLDGFFGVGDTSAFSVDGSLFSGLVAGASEAFTASMSTSVLGSFSADYTFSFSDEDLPGAASLGDLTLTLTGAVEAAGILGDFNGDTLVDALDIDMLFAAMPDTVPPGDAIYDLNNDGAIDGDTNGADDTDLEVLVHALLGTEFGDLNLDGSIAIDDFSTLSANFGMTGAGWADGDLNGDGLVTIDDFSLISANFGFSGSAGPSVSVPEPTAFGVLLVGCLGVVARRRSC